MYQVAKAATWYTFWGRPAQAARTWQPPPLLGVGRGYCDQLPEQSTELPLAAQPYAFPSSRKEKCALAHAGILHLRRGADEGFKRQIYPAEMRLALVTIGITLTRLESQRGGAGYAGGALTG